MMSDERTTTAVPLLRARELDVRHDAPPDGEGFRLLVPRFDLLPGELVALIGPNGAGKSTLLRVLADRGGHRAHSAGAIEVMGRPRAAWRRLEWARTVGYLPQHIPYDGQLVVEELVRMGRYAHTRALGFLGAGDLAAVERALHGMGVAELRQRRLATISGGERQRAFLAAVLAQEPRVLLLDEPTAGLDLHQQSSFFEGLLALAAGGLGVLVVTHEVNAAALYAARVLLLSEGRVRYEGSPDEVLRAAHLEAVYGRGLTVTTHPQDGRPMVLPLRNVGGAS
jgi:ferric hydroxamate transport system ATP-binding protein